MGKPPVKGGGGGMPPFLSTIIKFFMVFGVIFAIFQINGNGGLTFKGVWQSVVGTSNAIGDWARHIGNGLKEGKIDLGIGLNLPKTSLQINIPSISIPASKEPNVNGNADGVKVKFNGQTYDLQGIKNLANDLPIGYDSSAAYSRDEWRHWDNITSCWTVREQVLYRDAEKGSTTLLDKNKQPTTDVSKACYITGGTWIDPYTNQKFTNPSDLDVDHVIPLGYAARTGAKNWDATKKENYANYVVYNRHLLAVSASANRAKGDSGPSEWKPKNKAYWCDYGVAWTVIATKWQLSLKETDKNTVKDMLATCTK
jgi:hypothetical protein